MTLISTLLQQFSSDAVFFAMTWLDLPRKPKLEEELQFRKYLLLYQLHIKAIYTNHILQNSSRKNKNPHIVVGIKQLVTFQFYWHVHCDCIKPTPQLMKTSKALLPPVPTASI